MMLLHPLLHGTSVIHSLINETTEGYDQKRLNSDLQRYVLALVRNSTMR